MIGIGGAEIFPKQTSVREESGAVGNWIAMPYFGSTYEGKLREQVGIKRTGSEMTIGEFLTKAEASRVGVEDFAKLCAAKRSRSSRATGGDFSDGPPCLQHLAKGGFPEGGRNSSLFHMGVYCKKAFPDSWKEKLGDYNTRLMKPPLPYDEVAE